MNYVIELKEHGRLSLPKILRRQLGLTAGQKLTLEVEDDCLKVLTPLQQLENARKLLRQNPAWDEFSVDDFIRERREEAKKEEAKFGAYPEILPSTIPEQDT